VKLPYIIKKEKAKGVEKQMEDFRREEIVFSDAKFKISTVDSLFKAREKTVHEEIEIKYVYEGTGTFAIDDNIVCAEAGDVVVINPYEVHANVNLENRNGKYYNVMIGFDFFTDEIKRGLNLTQKLLLEGKKFCTLIKKDERLTTILRRVVEEMNGKREYYQIVIHSLIGELFAILLRGYLDEERNLVAGERKVDDVAVILPAITKIYEEYGEKLTVEYLAERCHLSKFYFCRIFKKITGKTVMQFILEYRLNVAETLVKNTKKSFADVAWACGFETEGYFAKCYKKSKGISPRRAREKTTENK
jgi:AraC-like DNA-binding protein/mannose-6-phosphate isomerase-like protein (cupin superfamily)